MTAQASATLPEPMEVHAESLEVFRKSNPAFAEYLETAGRVRIVDQKVTNHGSKNRN